MNIFRSMVGGNAGGQSEDSPAETVERLVERVQTVSLVEDRRDAVKALRSLAKEYRCEVGGQAMNVLVEVVEKDPHNSDTASLALDALAIIIDPDEDSEQDQIGQRFADIFISKEQNVSLVLSMLEDYEFNIRRPTVRLLTGLLRHRPHDLQDKLLHNPAAIPKIMDLLQETREILRNDTVLMLCELTRGNPHMQKLVAYENAFELLLDIVAREGESIVVEDCLFVVINLLKNNASNQQLFREHSLVKRMRVLLNNLLNHHVEEEDDLPQGLTTEMPDDTPMWNAQKITNCHMLLSVIRCLVSPSNPTSLTQGAQKIIQACGLLNDLCQLLLTSGIPADVLTEAIITVSELIRGHTPSQEFFGTVMAPVQPPKPAVLVLLMSMVNDKQPFALRCAVLYCFLSYLYKNDLGKQGVIQTLLPSSTEPGELTSGHLLCTALISSDPLLVWLSCVSLMHCLINAPNLKEQLLRVQLATSLGEAPISLLQQVWRVLMQHGGRSPQVRAGILMLLIVWLEHCPVAVTHFLHKDDNLAYLTTHTCGSSGAEGSESEQLVIQGLSAFLLAICVNFNDDSVEKNNRKTLLHVMERRVGCDTLVELIDAVSSSELYVRAAQKPMPSAKQTSDLLIDYEFTKVFKRLEGDLVKNIRPSDDGDEATLSNSVEHHDNIVQSYKDLIKRQDAQIVQLTAQVNKLEEHMKHTEQVLTNNHTDRSPKELLCSVEVDRLKCELENKCKLIVEKESVIEDLKSVKPVTNGVHNNLGADSELIGENAQVKEQVQHLNVLLAQKQAQTLCYQQFTAQWQAFYNQQINDPQQIQNIFLTQFTEMEGQLAIGWQAYETQSTQVNQIVGEKAQLEAQNNTLKETVDTLTQYINSIPSTPIAQDYSAEVEQLKNKLAEVAQQMQHQAIESVNSNTSRLLAERDCLSLRKEQDDLLVLLADQDNKIRQYRKRMRAIGHEVSDDDEDEDDDGQLYNNNNNNSNGTD